MNSPYDVTKGKITKLKEKRTHMNTNATNATKIFVSLQRWIRKPCDSLTVKQHIIEALLYLAAEFLKWRLW